MNYQPVSRYFAFEGAQIHYQIHLNSDKPTLILVHGGLGSCQDMDFIANHFCHFFQIINLDLRGHGKSTLGDGNLSYLQYQRDVEALLRSLSIQEACWIGFSDGGIVGYRMAIKGKVKQLAAIASHWRLQESDPAREIFNNLNIDDWKQHFAPSIERYHNDNPQPDFFTLFHQVKQMWCDTNPNNYPNNDVNAIRCKTMLIRGSDDFLFSRQEMLALANIIDADSQEILSAEHGILESHPHDLLVTLTSFFVEVCEKVTPVAASQTD